MKVSACKINVNTGLQDSKQLKDVSLSQLLKFNGGGYFY